MTTLRALTIALLLWLSANAFAGDAYTVGGVPVDASADTAIAAQTKAIRDGQMRAAQRLVDRLTFESERQGKSVPPVTAEDATRMIRSMGVGNERRSSNRYIGDITVAFVPSRVRDYIRSRDLTLFDTQTRERVIVPLENGRPVPADHPWSVALADPALQHGLTPLRFPDINALGTALDLNALARGNEDAVAQAASFTNGRQFLLADISGRTVTLRDVDADTGTVESLGRVSGADLPAAARAIPRKLEADWKAGNRQLTDASGLIRQPVTVLFGSLGDWQVLQRALSTSSRVRAADLEALSRTGASMTLTVLGEPTALAGELRAKGITLGYHPSYGPVVHRSSYRFAEAPLQGQ